MNQVCFLAQQFDILLSNIEHGDNKLSYEALCAKLGFEHKLLEDYMFSETGLTGDEIITLFQK